MIRYFAIALLYMLVLVACIIGGHAITDKTISVLGPSIHSVILGLFGSLLLGVLIGYTFITIAAAVLP